MEYGDTVILTKNGFQIPEKLLLPVGVYNESRCWGVPVTNVGYEIGSRNENRAKNQIILSPIPFNSWACTVRIQARLKDKPRMLYYLLDAISNAKDNNGKNIRTNVISISDNTSGYYSGRVIILVELVDLRKDAREIQDSVIKRGDVNNIKEKQSKVTGYSIRLLQMISYIKKSILVADKKADVDCKFLYYPDEKTGGNYLWVENDIITKNIKDIESIIKRMEIDVAKFNEHMSKDVEKRDEIEKKPCDVSVFNELMKYIENVDNVLCDGSNERVRMTGVKEDMDITEKEQQNSKLRNEESLALDKLKKVLKEYLEKMDKKFSESKNEIFYDIINSIRDIANRKKEFKLHSIDALSCMWLRTQAMAYLYSAFSQPFRFDYDLKENILRSEIHGESSSIRIAQVFELDLPSMCLATFHTGSKYIRIVVFKNDNCHERLVKISYKYNCSYNAHGSGDQDISSHGSNGLLQYITNYLSIRSNAFFIEPKNTDTSLKNYFNFDIKNIVSYSKRESKRYEVGAIEILGYCRDVVNKSINEISSEIKKRIGGFGEICVRDKDKFQYNSVIDVGYVNPYRIFLSCREEIKKENTFNDIICRVSRKYGVTIDVSDASAEMVTSDVITKLSSVDALIIVFSITDIEHQEYMQAIDKNKYIPNLGWLLFELGVGMGKRMPVVQLRDTTVVTKDQWTHWINVGRDSALYFIDRKKPEQMEIELEKSILAILYKLTVRKVA